MKKKILAQWKREIMNNPARFFGINRFARHELFHVMRGNDITLYSIRADDCAVSLKDQR